MLTLKQLWLIQCNKNIKFYDWRHYIGDAIRLVFLILALSIIPKLFETSITHSIHCMVILILTVGYVVSISNPLIKTYYAD
jgi:hypothetical protein